MLCYPLGLSYLKSVCVCVCVCVVLVYLVNSGTSFPLFKLGVHRGNVIVGSSFVPYQNRMHLYSNLKRGEGSQG